MTLEHLLYAVCRHYLDKLKYTLYSFCNHCFFIIIIVSLEYKMLNWELRILLTTKQFNDLGFKCFNIWMIWALLCECRPVCVLLCTCKLSLECIVALYLYPRPCVWLCMHTKVTVCGHVCMFFSWLMSSTVHSDHGGVLLGSYQPCLTFL